MCPFGSVKAETDGYRIYLGGRWGKKTAHGIPMQKIFTDKEEVMKTVEKAILLFRDQGITGERFGTYGNGKNRGSAFVRRTAGA